MSPGPESAGRRLVESLAGLGVNHCYCVPGESYLDVLDVLESDPGACLVSTRHESGAAFMAEADGKLTGVPAIAAATRVPGAANLAIGVHTALHDSTPLVVVLGQVASELLGAEGAFQGIDLEAFYRPITKWSVTLTERDDVATVARRLLEVATSGRPGPVAIVLPAGMQSGGEVTRAAGAETPGQPSARQPSARQPPPVQPSAGAQAPVQPSTGAPPDGPTSDPGPAEPGRAAAPRRGAAPEGTVRRIVERLAAARWPVAIVGGRTAGCHGELVELAERLGLGVYSSFRRQDRFPNDHAAYLGHLTIATSPALLEALRQADVVLALGCRLAETTTQGYSLPGAGAFFVDVDSFSHATFPGRAADLPVVADVGATLLALVDAARAVKAGGGLERFRAAHEAYLDASTPPAPTDAGAALHPADVVAAMARRLPPESIVANDAGNFAIFLHRYWRYNHPFTQLAPTSGAMGYAVPAGVAAALRRPRQLAVAVAGDGGYLMTGQELETAVRLGRKLVVVVMRNGLYGTIAMHQARAFGRLSGSGIGEVDLAAHARSLGASAWSARDRAQLDDALSEALRVDEPALVDAVVDPDVLAPGVSLAELLTPGAGGGERPPRVTPTARR